MGREARQGFLVAKGWIGERINEPAVGHCARYRLYCYAAERHRRPHVDVRRGGEHATLDVVTGEVLAGELPPRVLRAVQDLLEEHRHAALHAFNETLEHRFPGSLEASTETSDD